MTKAKQKRADRIVCYKAAYLAAHGHSIGVCYTGRRYRLGSGVTSLTMTGPELDRAAQRLMLRAS